MNGAPWFADLGNKPAAAGDAVVVALPPSHSTMTEHPLHRKAKGRVPIAAPPKTETVRLQRLSEVRRREDLSRREVARRLRISVQEVEAQEQPCADMLLSELYRWEKALGVPVSELVNEISGEFSPPVRLRIQLLRAMKTIRSLQESAQQASVQRLAQTLVEQLLAIMPELKDTVAWPAVGQRRRQDELGQAFLRGLAIEPIEEQDAWDT
jgi:transcriptional regulator with XRE-family HTH domain